MEREGKREFVKYTFYKVSAERRWLPDQERQRSTAEFEELFAELAGNKAIASYSLVGTRGDVDFILWEVSPTLEAINELGLR